MFARPFFQCLIAFLVWQMPLCASAQIEPPPDLGYDPPEGWEYVRRLDSLNFVFYVHNDSIYMASKSMALNSPDMLEYSIDGGKTWQPSISSRPGLYPLWASNIQGTTILWNELVSNDSIHTLLVSTDLGQSWQNRARMNDFVPNIKISTREDGIITDLHYPSKNWFMKYKIDQTAYRYMYFSTDGGFIWKLLEIPSPSNYQTASAVNFDIKFDYREPGAWYFMSRGIVIPHFGTNDTTTEYYVSRDQGKTYIQIPLLGDFVGITDSAEHFLWTRSDEECSNDPHYNGFSIIDSLSQERSSVELLKDLLPYKYPLNSTKCDGPFIRKENSHFFCLEPNQGLLFNVEGKRGIITDTVFFDSTRLYFTKNAYQSTEIIFQSGSRGRALYTYLDEMSGYVWLVTSDTPKVRYYNDGENKRKSLWKRKVFTLTPSSIKPKQGSAEDIYIVYDNASNTPHLIVNQYASQYTSIALYDILGRQSNVLLDGILAKGRHTFLISNHQSSSGLHLLRFEQPEYSRTLKIFIRQ